MSNSYLKKIKTPGGAEYVIKDSSLWNILDVQSSNNSISNVINDIYAKLGSSISVSYEKENTLSFRYDTSNKIISGVTYSTSSNSTATNSKTAPAGAKLATLTTIGGASYKYNQIFEYPTPIQGDANAAWTASGATATNIDGGIQVNVVSSSGGVYKNANTVTNHKYYVAAEINQATSLAMNIRLNASSTNSVSKTFSGTTRLACIGTATSTACRVYFRGASGSVHTIKNVNVVDLTYMYGSGNEPTATTDARIVALEAYLVNHGDYTAPCVMNARPIITVTKNGNVLCRAAIPMSVLAAYPLRSAGSVYDTLVYSGGNWTHTQNVAYTPFDGTDSWTGTSALGTPILTDVTSLMNWDGIINVEPGATIEFVQEDNIVQTIPNTIQYKIDSREVTA